MRAQRRHRPVNQCPIVPYSPRKQGCVFVFRGHNHAISLKGLEVSGQCQRNPRTASRKRCVSHRVLFHFWNISNAWIFDTPNLFRIFARICRQRRFGIDTPVIDSIRGACGTEVRHTSSIFHTAKQQSISIRQEHGSCVEDAVYRIGPVLAAEDGISGISLEQRLIGISSRFMLFMVYKVFGLNGRKSWIQDETLIS